MGEKNIKDNKVDVKKEPMTTNDIIKSIPTYGKHKVCTHAGLVKIQDHVIECAQKGYLPKVVAPQKGWQEEAMRSKAAHLVMHAERGGGKMQPCDSDIHTPMGVVKMGDLKVGDIIFNPTGQSQTVTEIFEHGIQDVYEFTMIDGSKVESGLEHLWFASGVINTKTNNESLHRGKINFDLCFYGEICTTKDIIENINLGNINMRLPICRMLYFRKDVNIDLINKSNTLPLVGTGGWNGLRITDYKYVGKKQCRCISVSHPNRLYVTNDFIVTHNTFVLLMRILDKTRNPKFSGIAYRKNKLEAEKGEGIIAKAKELFCPHFGEYKIADRKIVFKNGGELYFDYFGDSGTDDDSYDKFVARTQGGSYSDVLIDEASQAPADKMEYMQSVNRSVSGLKPQMHMACNPNPDSPLADMVMSHWADDDGNPIPENSGDKMYYFKLSDSEFIWAKSPKEMWYKAKNELIEANPKKKLTEENCHTVLKQVSFLYCDFQSNKILDTLSPNYQGSLRTGDAAKDAINLYGSWAKILKTDDIITNQMMYDWFYNSPQYDDNFLCSTLDPAWGGGDYAVQCKWIGHHWDDVEFSKDVDGSNLIEWIRRNLSKWGIPENRLAFDGFGSNDVKGRMKEAHPILYEVIQVPNRNKKEQTVKFYRNLKSQMADGFVNRLKEKGYSVNPRVLEKLFGTKTIEKALMKQKKVIKFEEEKADGKISIIGKKMMKQILGGGDSPDLMEAVLYREFFDLKQINKPLSTQAKNRLRWI